MFLPSFQPIPPLIARHGWLHKGFFLAKKEPKLI